VFDRSGPGVFAIDSHAASLLVNRSAGRSLGEAVGEVARLNGEQDAGCLVREYGILRRQGYFQTQVPALDATAEQRLIQGYCRWATKGIQLFLIEGCNLDCRYCYAGRNEALRRHRMPPDVARSAVDFAFRRARARRSVVVSLFGGEPLLHREGIEYAVRYARRLAQRLGKRVRFSLTTNGTLVDAEVVQFIRRFRVDVVLSLDGPPEVQNKLLPLVGGGNSFSRVMTGYEHLLAAGIRPLVRATVTNHCLDRRRLVEFMESISAPKAQLTYAEARSGRPGSFDIGPEACEELVGLEEQFAAHHVERLSAGEVPPIDPFRRTLSETFGAARWSLPCGVGRAVMTVDIEGRLYPCHRYVGMPNYVIGDIEHGMDLKRLREYYASYFRVMRNCDGCWASGYCTLKCPWYFSDDDGELRPLPEWRCDFARHQLETAIWIYAQAAVRAPRYLEDVLGHVAGGQGRRAGAARA